MAEFRIHFTVVIAGCLRSKWKKVEAVSINAAIAKLKAEFGKLKVWKVE